MRIVIKENSRVAQAAARWMKTDNIAIVFGRTIHLWNASKEELLRNKRWLYHELMHVRQYKKHGFIGFLFLYLKESLKHGYYNNRFEKEAREAEESETDTDEFQIEG